MSDACGPRTGLSTSLSRFLPAGLGDLGDTQKASQCIAKEAKFRAMIG